MTLILKFYPSMNGIFMPFLSNFIQNRSILLNPTAIVITSLLNCLYLK
ncbi:unnamed protein product [Staphylococcus haemolyticus JCSC1435]|uniref:Uncharacterized protein n=1 Tax=Staphylococcus haemolyticus (strain JCSC1435) TaxID=279808 RepID=Q4L353_STAHJ|nr:unnamed protein product [Staphylococcus haemolyticus JCSC1435]